VVLAQEEARTLRHTYIGTEHVLLGLIREEEGVAARVLTGLGFDLRSVRETVVRMVGTGEEVSSGQIPFTPRAKKVLELALRESLTLGHNYIGTEHILLGVVRENEGVAARVLLEFGADAEKVRNEVIRALSGMRSPYAYSPSGPDHAVALLARAAPEIRDRFGRGADRGGLLLVLASAPSGVVARAFGELGIDPEALRAALDRAREQAPDELEDQLRDVRRRKDEAVKAGEIDEARRALDAEAHLLVEQDADAMEAARRFLGL
jgi:ATP-dependent Clp protease ATP-binding subunit ClpA